MPTTQYLWDELSGNLLAEETDGQSAVYTQEPTSNGLISQHRDGASSYYHFDATDSTRQLTDESGAITDEMTYSAFGDAVSRTGSTVNPWGFKGAIGYYTNSATNDIYVQSRTYEPALARWMSPLADGRNSYPIDDNNPVSIGGIEVMPVVFSSTTNQRTDDTARKKKSGIKVCWRRTRIPVAGKCGARHYWLETPSESVGRGTRDKCCNSCVLSKTQQIDHSDERAIDCDDAEYWMNKDEHFSANFGDWRCRGPAFVRCMDKELSVGGKLGPFIPVVNDCKTFVQRTLKKCCKWEHHTDIPPFSGIH